MGQWKSELHGSDDKLPTVSQWMKTVSSEAKISIRLVKQLWIPNLFDNYSLDTESYRFRVPPSHGLFRVLEDNLEDWIENDAVLALHLSDSKKPEMTLLTLDNEMSVWSEMGAYGWKLGQVEAKPKKTSGYKTRKSNALSSALPSEPQEGAPN